MNGKHGTTGGWRIEVTGGSTPCRMLTCRTPGQCFCLKGDVSQHVDVGVGFTCKSSTDLGETRTVHASRRNKEMIS